ncbi:hypothetical protein CB1_000932008 [Camelus ferus]|nr:hypothetical protein CB1_000932008 [Camelus ferus]
MKSVRTLAGSAPRLRPTPCAQPGARQSSQGEKKEQPDPEPGAEEPPQALDEFEAAAHSTPVRKEVTDKEREFAAGAARQLEYQQLEDDKLSQKSYSSKLSRSPLKIVKKPKSMQCKVILLDGSEYTCDVEVWLRPELCAGRRALRCLSHHIKPSALCWNRGAQSGSSGSLPAADQALGPPGGLRALITLVSSCSDAGAAMGTVTHKDC